jgi:hypothetical protein
MEAPMSDTTLRKKLVRLAHAKPELRADLLPLLTREAGYWDDDEFDRRREEEAIGRPGPYDIPYVPNLREPEPSIWDDINEIPATFSFAVGLAISRNGYSRWIVAVPRYDHGGVGAFGAEVSVQERPLADKNLGVDGASVAKEILSIASMYPNFEEGPGRFGPVLHGNYVKKDGKADPRRKNPATVAGRKEGHKDFLKKLVKGLQRLGFRVKVNASKWKL